MADPGVLWSIRYYGQDDGSAKMILAKEIERILNKFEDDDVEWTSADLADALVQDMDLKPSGTAELAITPQRVQKALALMQDEEFEFDYEDVVKAVLTADQEARKS